ncbi:MAG: FKBP-type peptidyl-prolyl cis-trans isomerase [Mucilaginibacter sp.]|uniref:FKBP-type peptidyl-prolyl cis-trans isomerase n=1 Tax=Mucilaginibacter sp. TaxID=1882438 RepID=UPI0032658340
MKRILYTLMVLCAFGLLSCRKSGTDISLKQFDDNQIQNYIKSNNLTEMKPYTGNGDTTGIYYQVIIPGKGDSILNTTQTAYLYTAKSFDGQFNSSDTILNHVYSYAPYIGPTGLQTAIKNIAKTRGTKIRVLVPSRMAYGINGTTVTRYTSNTTTSTTTIPGNQGIDYTITIMDEKGTMVVTNPLTNQPETVLKQAVYDEISIKKYLAAQGFSGYTRIDTGKYKGLYYKITKAGTGTDKIGIGSVVGVQYTGFLFNTAIFDQQIIEGNYAASSLILYKDEVVDAMLGALPKATAGADISIITPSALAYGVAGATNSASGGFGIPAFSCLRFDMSIITVAN